MLVNSQIGDAQTDSIVANILDVARSIWPEGTTQFEAWVNQQLSAYGISYAKYEASRYGSTLSQYSGWIWLGAIGIFLWTARK